MDFPKFAWRLHKLLSVTLFTLRVGGVATVINSGLRSTVGTVSFVGITPLKEAVELLSVWLCVEQHLGCHMWVVTMRQ